MKLLTSTFKMLLTKEKEVRAVILNIDPITGDLIAQVNNQRAIIAPKNISMYEAYGNEDSNVKRLLGSTIHANVIGRDNKNIILSEET